MNTPVAFFQAALWTVFFIIPGYIAASQKHFWMLTTPRQPIERTIESIIWSFPVYITLAIIPSSIFDLDYFFALILEKVSTPEKIIFTITFIKNFSFVIFIATSVGFLYGLVIPKISLSRLFNRSHYARVWDEFFFSKQKAMADDGIWIEMRDGTQWAGKLRSASDTPGSSELWITDLRKYHEGNLCETHYSDLLVRSEEILRLFVLNKGLCPPKHQILTADIWWHQRIYSWLQRQRQLQKKEKLKNKII